MSGGRVLVTRQEEAVFKAFKFALVVGPGDVKVFCLGRRGRGGLKPIFQISRTSAIGSTGRDWTLGRRLRKREA